MAKHASLIKNSLCCNFSTEERCYVAFCFFKLMKFMFIKKTVKFIAYISAWILLLLLHKLEVGRGNFYQLLCELLRGNMVKDEII